MIITFIRPATQVHDTDPEEFEYCTGKSEEQEEQNEEHVQYGIAGPLWEFAVPMCGANCVSKRGIVREFVDSG
jgi:hypothetical protein